MINTKRMAALAALLAVAGCATQPHPMRVPAPPPSRGQRLPAQPAPKVVTPPQTSEQQSANTTGNAKAPPRTAAQASSPAVMSLLGSADTLAKAGHMGRAAAMLERALDLEPQNPFIYQRLAAVRLAQGQTGQAVQLAHKSNSVAGNNPYVEAANWRLIAEARRTQGDNKAAQQASAHAASYSKASDQSQ